MDIRSEERSFRSKILQLGRSLSHYRGSTDWECLRKLETRYQTVKVLYLRTLITPLTVTVPNRNKPITATVIPADSTVRQEVNSRLDFFLTTGTNLRVTGYFSLTDLQFKFYLGGE